MGATVSSLAAGQRTEQVEAARRARGAAEARAREQVRPVETAPNFAPDRFELPSPAQSAKAPVLSGAAFRDLSPRDRFEPPSADRQVNAHLLSVPERSGAAKASTLMTEDASDSKVNCLDRAVDCVRGLPEGQRQSAELVLLTDKRPGAEGLTGHAVVQQGSDVVDPSSGETYGSMQEYLARNPQYAEAGRISGPDTEKIFSAPPGSAARRAALDQASVPQALRDTLVADSEQAGQGELFPKEEVPVQAETPLSEKIAEAGNDETLRAKLRQEAADRLTDELNRNPDEPGVRVVISEDGRSASLVADGELSESQQAIANRELTTRGMEGTVRPRLTDDVAEKILQDIHNAPTAAGEAQDPRALEGRTSSLTQLEDGRVVVSNSNGLSKQQREVAERVLQEAGFDREDIITPRRDDVLKPTTHDHEHRHLKGPDGERIEDCHHAEAQGQRAAELHGSPVDRQWSYSDAQHAGKACKDCTREEKVNLRKGANRTGRQAEGVQGVIPGMGWKKLRKLGIKRAPTPNPPAIEGKSPGSPGAAGPQGPDGKEGGGTSTKPKKGPSTGGSGGAAAEPKGSATKKQPTGGSSPAKDAPPSGTRAPTTPASSRPPSRPPTIPSPSSPTVAARTPPAGATGAVKGLPPDVAKALTQAESTKLESLASKVGTKNLEPTLAKLKDPASVKGLMGQLDKLSPADGQRLLNAIGDMASSSMQKALSDPATADSLGKMAKNLDGEGAKAARTILKGLDAEASKSFLKLAGNAPSGLLNEGLRTLAPVVDKVGGKAFGSGLKFLDKVLGKMGMSLGTLGAEAIPKVFKTFAKILPAVGAVPGLIDAGNYLNEAASLRGKNKDLAMFATVGAGLNTSDVVVGTLLDATGVGAAVDVATGTAFGIAELALDLSFDSEKKKMEANPAGYRAPDWMKAVNLGYGAATGASGAAALIANYGVDGTVDLLKWGSQKGSQAVGKVVASLKDAGSEGLALLRSLAMQGFQSARDALSSLGQSVKNATDGEFQIGGKKIDLNPFW